MMAIFIKLLPFLLSLVKMGIDYKVKQGQIKQADADNFFDHVKIIESGSNTSADLSDSAEEQINDLINEYAPVSVPTNLKRCNQEGIKLICEFEGFFSKPYLCPAKVPTIGYGTTIYPSGIKVKLSDPKVSEEKAKEYLAYDLRNEENNLIKFMDDKNIALCSNQFSALVSFAYNLGFGAISSQSSTVYRGLTTNDHKLTCKGLKLYVKANGRKLAGLVRRRQAEVDLYNRVA